jgi:protein ImuB
MRWCHVHLPRFPVQRRVTQTPSLAGKPLALVENARGHLRVAFVSTTALKGGVRVGMTRTAACALVPELRCFPYVPEEERQALASLGEALLQCGPRFQLSPPEGLFLDASAAHLFEGEEGLAERILEVCAAHGYRGRVVVATEAFTARALARHGARRVECVPFGESGRALAPLPLAALDLDIGGLAGPLRSLGLTTLGEVAALPAGAVIARLGAAGLRAHRLCRGDDETPFVAEPLAEVLEERMELDWPAEAKEPLLFALKTSFDRACGRLYGRSRAAVRLELVLRLDPAGEARVPLTLARPIAQARVLLDLARCRIADLTLPNPVSGVSVTILETSEDQGRQLPLGDEPEGDAALEVVLSRLSTALGQETLFSAELGDAHRPEAAYAPRAFRPPEPEHGLLAEAARASAGSALASSAWVQAQAAGSADRRGALHVVRGEAPSGDVESAGVGPGAEVTGHGSVPLPSAPPELRGILCERPVRFFDRPASLDAEMGAAGEIVSARLLGRRRKVEAWAGPERLCGEWWEAAYARDYYRVHFEGLGQVWLYRDERDGRFYLHGMFD